MKKPPTTSPPALLSKDHEMVAASRLQPHPANVNEGDLGAIHQSMDENKGFYGSLLVERETGNIIAGSHRFKVGVDRGMKEFPVDWFDGSPDDAIRIMLADNESARRGSNNTAALVDLLKELATASERGLEGTLYSPEDLDQFIADLQAQALVTSGLKDGADPDEIPENVPTRAKLGDIWQLGGHTTCPKCQAKNQVGGGSS